jgi:hypothetical protein
VYFTKSNDSALIFTQETERCQYLTANPLGLCYYLRTLLNFFVVEGTIDSLLCSPITDLIVSPLFRFTPDPDPHETNADQKCCKSIFHLCLQVIFILIVTMPLVSLHEKDPTVIMFSSHQLVLFRRRLLQVTVSLPINFDPDSDPCVNVANVI